MPKATLSFILPEEQEEFNTTMLAADYKHALYEFDQALRHKTKYGTEPSDWPEQPEPDLLDPLRVLPPYDEYVAHYFYETIRELLWQTLRKNNVELD